MFRARSITQMVLFGFLIVLLPVLAALIYAAESLRTMAKTHRDHLVSVADAADTSQNLAKSMVDLERLARQYHLLNDPKLLELFNRETEKVEESLQRLRGEHQDADLLRGIDRLGEGVQDMRKGLNQAIADEVDPVFEAIQLIPELNRSMQKLRLAIEGDLRHKVSRARQLTELTQMRLLLVGLIVLPLTLLLIGIFSGLITRPMKSIDLAIKSIGMGQYPTEIKLSGPRDLQILAKRLTWLGQRLKDSEASQERFLRHISHELKTPLASIKEGIELLADQIPGPINSNQKEVLDILQTGLIHFQKLINNLLDFNLLRGNKILMRAPTNVGELISGLCRLHQLTASRKSLQFDLVGEPLLAYLDKSVISAAVDNLLSNALNFSPEGGRITVRWYQADTSLELIVGDEGPGIIDEEREKVFLPFYQGKALRNGPLKGTGLGLSVARECIHSHGGDLRILESKNGAWFALSLPDVFRETPKLSQDRDRAMRPFQEAPA